jgi:amidase
MADKGYRWEIDTGEDRGEPWRAKAAVKRAEILKQIPSEWQLDAKIIEDAKNRRDITGDYMKQFFEQEEFTILSLDTVPIVEAVKQKKYTAEQVARAFCKAAAIAHQIVSSVPVVL